MRRSLLSPSAPWPATDPLYDLSVPLREVTGADLDFTTDERADYLAAERTQDPAATEAVRCEGLRRKLITLFNEPEIEWSEKRDALAYLETIRTNLPRLEAWRRNVAAEVGRRRAQGPRRRLALRATLARPCPSCQATPGYNAETCQACLDYATSQQAA